MSWQIGSFTPTGKASRSERKARARRIEQARAATVAPRRKIDELPQLRSQLERWGTGLADRTYWNPARLAQQPIKAAAGDVAGIYPFIADAGIGSSGPVLGLDLGADSLFHFSPWDAVREGIAFSTNVLITGAFHSGKSATAKILAMRSLAFAHQVIVPSDSKGEWVEIAKAVGGDTYQMGAPGVRINPLEALPPRSGEDHELHMQGVRDRRRNLLISITEAVAGVRLDAIQHAVLHWALDRACESSGDRPTLRRVWRHLARPTADELRENEELFKAATTPRYVLERFVSGDLQGLFEDESSIAFDPSSPMVVIDTSKLFERSELAAMVTQMCSASWIQAAISDVAAARTRYIIREEGWRDMASLQALKTYQQWLKLSRHYGVSNITLMHKTGDFDAVGPEGSEERALAYSLLADFENKFVFRQNTQEYDALVNRLKLPTAHAKTALTLDQGSFIAYVGRNAYFVDAFAASTPFERGLVRTDHAIIDPLSGEPTVLHCDQCESMIDPSWRFCIYCGKPVNR